MADITVSLPRTVSNINKLDLTVANTQELFKALKEKDHNIFETMFRINDAEIWPKAFVSMFINDDQVFDYCHSFSDGDCVVFSMAIAGG